VTRPATANGDQNGNNQLTGTKQQKKPHQSDNKNATGTKAAQ